MAAVDYFLKIEGIAGESADYAGSIPSTNLKVTGVNVFSAGDFMGAPGTEQIVFRDRGLGIAQAGDEATQRPCFQ